MKTFLKNNGLYYGFYLTVLLACAYYLVNIEKLQLHVNINTVTGNAFFDKFYRFFTHVGDGITAVLIGLIVLFVNLKKGLYLLLSYAVAGGLTSILKNFGANYARPHHVFSYYHKEIKLHYVEGVNMIGEFSFPSGHSTAAFATFTGLALITNKPWLKIIYLLIAVNAAFSRIYLSQHWLVDIVAGSIIGVGISTILYFVFFLPSRNEKLDRPLFKKQ